MSTYRCPSPRWNSARPHRVSPRATVMTGPAASTGVGADATCGWPAGVIARTPPVIAREDPVIDPERCVIAAVIPPVEGAPCEPSTGTATAINTRGAPAAAGSVGVVVVTSSPAVAMRVAAGLLV